MNRAEYDKLSIRIREIFNNLSNKTLNDNASCKDLNELSYIVGHLMAANKPATDDDDNDD